MISTGQCVIYNNSKELELADLLDGMTVVSDAMNKKSESTYIWSLLG